MPAEKKVDSQPIFILQLCLDFPGFFLLAAQKNSESGQIFICLLITSVYFCKFAHSKSSEDVSNFYPDNKEEESCQKNSSLAISHRTFRFPNGFCLPSVKMCLAKPMKKAEQKAFN